VNVVQRIHPVADCLLPTFSRFEHATSDLIVDSVLLKTENNGGVSEIGSSEFSWHVQCVCCGNVISSYLHSKAAMVSTATHANKSSVADRSPVGMMRSAVDTTIVACNRSHQLKTVWWKWNEFVLLLLLDPPQFI